jgi:hypothetical protein
MLRENILKRLKELRLDGMRLAKSMETRRRKFY